MSTVGAYGDLRRIGSDVLTTREAAVRLGTSISRIHVASLARSQRIGTSIAEYSVHHIAPEVFGGFTGTDASGYMATPEKALFDAVYVRASRGGPVHMPDLSFPADFDYAELANWADKLPAGRHRTLVSRALKTLPTPVGAIGEA